MDRLDMALYLIQEAKENRDILKSFHSELHACKNWNETNKVYEKYKPPYPTAAGINANLKMARKLLLKEYI